MDGFGLQLAEHGDIQGYLFWSGDLDGRGGRLESDGVGIEDPEADGGQCPSLGVGRNDAYRQVRKPDQRQKVSELLGVIINRPESGVQCLLAEDDGDSLA